MAPNPESKAIVEKMDAAAAKAAKEFQATWSAKEVATWFKKWYMEAGYKRLSKILIAAFNGG